MTKTSPKKVVLAYSGGLDTSYCIKYLTSEHQMDVYAVLVNTGGFTPEETDVIGKKAIELGASDFVELQILESYYQDCVRYLIYGNILRNNTYPLSVSAERMYQAISIADYAKDINADAIAHGSTGAGNDQIRFDIVFQTLVPDMQIITPIRDGGLSRQDEITYLKNHGVDMDWSKAEYSINQGLWGTSVGGKETLTSSSTLPESAYPSQLEQTQPRKITLTFTQGELTHIDGEKDRPVQNIIRLQKIASEYAIGRDVHVGDTIIGIKGRVGFEAAAPMIIIKAHHLLEKHVQTKWQMYWKDQLANSYGAMIHEAMFLDPVMKDIEAFLYNSQQRVTGDVHVILQPYNFILEGIESKYDLMDNKLGVYGEENKSWSSQDAEGFIKIFSNPYKIFYSKEEDYE